MYTLIYLQDNTAFARIALLLTEETF